MAAAPRTPEFELIARYFSSTAAAGGVLLGVGDDCALLAADPAMELAVSTDTLVADVHFFSGTDPRNLGHKALAVNLSDLAAMGAVPRWFTLALTLPAVDAAFLEGFAGGLLELAAGAGIALVGGDTTRGPLAMTLTVIGEVPRGQALRRSGARAGDDIWVSGTLGDAALGLALLRKEISLPPALSAAAIAHLERPTPRVALGIALREIASSAIDVSDGLAADLRHICERSAVGARLEATALPLSAALRAVPDAALQMRWALAGGDDYELCFCAAPQRRAAIAALAAELALPLSHIGTIGAGSGVEVFAANGAPVALAHSGYDHFARA